MERKRERDMGKAIEACSKNLHNFWLSEGIR